MIGIPVAGNLTGREALEILCLSLFNKYMAYPGLSNLNDKDVGKEQICCDKYIYIMSWDICKLD